MSYIAFVLGWRAVGACVEKDILDTPPALSRAPCLFGGCFKGLFAQKKKNVTRVKNILDGTGA
jgi:hypothetical protein